MKSLAELAAIRNKMIEQVNLRKDDNIDTRVVVGMATCGIAAGARPVLAAFIEEVNNRSLTNISVTQSNAVSLFGKLCGKIDRNRRFPDATFPAGNYNTSRHAFALHFLLAVSFTRLRSILSQIFMRNLSILQSMDIILRKGR